MPVPIGPITNIFCCGDQHGSPVGGVAPYVVSLQGLSGILTLDGQGAIDITQSGGVIYFSLNASAGLGTVTSVGVSSNSAALVVGSSPVTTAGTITLALDASLTGIAALGWVADTFAYGTGVDTFALSALTAYARTLLDDANAATARATLGGTTVGQGIFTLTNPSAITFLRINADNTTTARSSADFKTDLGLVIGTNVQAWSADLDSFVTNASWSGSNLSLAGELAVAAQIQGLKVLALGAATAGERLFYGSEDGNDVFEVLDTGDTTITAVTGFTGSILTVTSVDLANLFRVNEAGDGTFLGSCIAADFAGDGGGITGLDASQISSGTLSNSRLDSDLAALGNNSSNGLWARTASGTGSARTITGSSFISVTNGDGVSGNPTLTLSPTTGVAGSVVLSVSPAIVSPSITAPAFDKTITGAGTTGNQTINKTCGSVRFAAAATSLIVTNSLVVATSVIVATVGSNDATMNCVKCVAASGTFTIYPDAAPTAETIVYFIVVN